ncbi:hypothetical protein IJE86_02820 [bacterium]|nr:hypothetical protein [bacterium]
MKKLLVILLCFMVVFTAIVMIIAVSSNDSNNTNNSEVNVVSTDWKTTFIDNGFTNDEIDDYNEILNNVGIKDFHDVELHENGRMHTIKGKIYDSDECFLHITLEERKIICIWLSMPDLEYNPYLNWRGKVKFRYEQSWKSVDLYYDIEGGYVNKLDWENKMISPYYE